MKKVSLIAAGLLLLAYQPIMSQTIDDEITLVQGVFCEDKKAIIETSMELPEAMLSTFRAVYDEYETAGLANRRKRIKIINDYLESFLNPGEAEVDSLALSLLKNDIDLALLDGTNYKKATSAPQTAKFIQIDTNIHNKIGNAL